MIDLKVLSHIWTNDYQTCAYNKHFFSYFSFVKHMLKPCVYINPHCTGTSFPSPYVGLLPYVGFFLSLMPMIKAIDLVRTMETLFWKSHNNGHFYTHSVYFIEIVLLYIAFT